jgi:hypothetical protein
MKAVARRDPQYQVKLFNEKANKDTALLHGVQRGSVQATNTAKTRSRHLNQELTMISFFLRAGEAMMRDGGAHQDIYDAWVDCAQQLMRPLGKVNPSNRAGSPLYDDLHVMLQAMIDRGVISAVDDVPELPPFYCMQPMPGLVGPLHPAYTFASVAHTEENLFE